MSRKNRRRDRYDNMFEDYYDDYSGYEEDSSSDSRKKTDVWEEPATPSNANLSASGKARKEAAEERDAWQSVLQEEKKSNVPSHSEGNATPDIPTPPRSLLFRKWGGAILAGGKKCFHHLGKIFSATFRGWKRLGEGCWRMCRKVPRRYLLTSMASVGVLVLIGGGIWFWLGSAEKSTGKEVAQSESEVKKEVTAPGSTETIPEMPAGEVSSEESLPTLDLPTSPAEKPEEGLATHSPETLPSLEGNALPDLTSLTETPVTETVPETTEPADPLASIMDGLGITEETATPPSEKEAAAEETGIAALGNLTTDALALPSELAPAEETLETGEIPLVQDEKVPENQASAKIPETPPAEVSEEEVLSLETLTPVDIPKPQKKNTLADSLASIPEADTEHILAPPGFAPEPSEPTVPEAETTVCETPDPYLPNTLSAIPESTSDVQDPFSGNLGGSGEIENAGDLENPPSLISATSEAKETKEKESADDAKEKKISNDTVYVVQEGDNYWNISEKVYGTGSYFRAIAQYNSVVAPNPNKLVAGTKLLIPNVSFLRSCYPALCPESGEGVARAGTSPQSGPSQAYYVVQDGDTLSDIARRQLGSASRWPEIYRLNRDALNNRFDLLVPGVELVLPPVENHVASESSLWK
ncbi:MAG: LysM peptidoglycan-binding domain-containing protein [Planctomycetia bacterium]|nr:LysM peptidoglycan-binding domain-containing protein [Planctomycetia bacterium]